MRDGDDPQVQAVGGAVAEERAALAAGRDAVVARDGDRQPAQAVAHVAVGRDDLRELGRPAARRGGAGNAPPRRAPMRCDQLALGAQPAVDLRAQLAAHRQVADERRQRDGDAHGQRGHEHQAPAQGHGCSRST